MFSCSRRNQLSVTGKRNCFFFNNQQPRLFLDTSLPEMSPLALATLACAGSLLPPPFCSLPGAEAPQCKIPYHQDAARCFPYPAHKLPHTSAPPNPSKEPARQGHSVTCPQHSSPNSTPSRIAREPFLHHRHSHPKTHKVLVRCERQTCRRAGGLVPYAWHQTSRHSAAPYPRRADGVATWAWLCGLCVLGMAAGRVGN